MATDDVVVVVSPHNEAIRYEFGRAFATWYRERTGRSVSVDWRVLGGTGEIARYLEGAYASSFETWWTRRLRRAWRPEIAASFQKGKLAADASEEARDAKRAFLESEASCGIDVFFGGDTYQYGKEAAAGHLVDCGLLQRHPEWFGPDKIPRTFRGQTFWDAEGRWYGSVLSAYGIIYNRDVLGRLGVEEPRQWTDLANPKLAGAVALADPTKSGSVCEAFENILQQQMQRRLAALARDMPGLPAAEREKRAVHEGWIEGLRLIQRIGANARYFTDNSQKPPIDVAAGDCAAGLCIDFYGRQQQEAVRRRGNSDRVGFVLPPGGSAISADPIGLLRGAPHREAGTRFVEFVLSPEGQKLWALRPGTSGGPERYALRRTPIRADFFADPVVRSARSDPADDPYDAMAPFVYRPEWTGDLFRDIGFVCRVLCQDTHLELADAWRRIQRAPPAERSRAMAYLEDLAPVSYDRVRGSVHDRLNAKDRVEEVRLATELTTYFRERYRQAAAACGE